MNETCRCGMPIAPTGMCPKCGYEGSRYRQNLEARQASRAAQQAPHPATDLAEAIRHGDDPVSAVEKAAEIIDRKERAGAVVNAVKRMVAAGADDAAVEMARVVVVDGGLLGASTFNKLVKPPSKAQAQANGHGQKKPASDHTNISGKVPDGGSGDPPPMTIAQVEAVYARWLHDEADPVPTRVVHAVYVANLMLSGDPVWVILVGGSGQGKTERLIPLAGLPYVELASQLSGPAALLSAVSQRDRVESAHGGLLRRIGAQGLLVVKDFTSILEMDRTARSQVLAALREVYDGRWDREVGTDGGQTFHWSGKCGFISGCTTAIDKAHGVMNDMGPRSLFVRLPPTNIDRAAKAALTHMGHEQQMRAELSRATAGLLMNLPGAPHELTEDVQFGLIGLASLVSQSRSPVHRDWKGEIELIGDAEAPTRIIKQLGQLWRACGMLGLGLPESWGVVQRCALDSIPKLRGLLVRHVAELADPASTTDVSVKVKHPTQTVRRALQDLAAHSVIKRVSAGPGKSDLWVLTDRARAWMSAADTFPEMLESREATSSAGGQEAASGTLQAIACPAGHQVLTAVPPGERAYCKTCDQEFTQ